VVLGQVLTGKTHSFDEFDEPQTLVEKPAQRRAGGVEMIEYAETEHAGSP